MIASLYIQLPRLWSVSRQYQSQDTVKAPMICMLAVYIAPAQGAVWSQVPQAASSGVVATSTTKSSSGKRFKVAPKQPPWPTTRFPCLEYMAKVLPVGWSTPCLGNSNWKLQQVRLGKWSMVYDWGYRWYRYHVNHLRCVLKQWNLQSAEQSPL